MFLAIGLLALATVTNSSAGSPSQLKFDEIARQAEMARAGDHVPEAIQFYQKGLVLRPKWSEGWWWLGNLLYEQDRFPEAEAAFSRFVVLKPEAGVAYALLGLCEYRTRDYVQAKEHLQKWVQSGHPGPRDLMEVATFHRALLLTRDGRFPQSLFLLAGEARNRGESPSLVEAMGLASLGIARLPEESPAELRERVWLAGKAALYASMGDFSRAQEYSQRLLEHYGQEPNVHYFAGSLYSSQSRRAEATEEYRKELQFSPQNLAAMLELARIEIDGNELREGIELSRQAVKLEPRNSDAHHMLGRALLAAEEYQESIVELEKAKRLAPRGAAIRFHLATAYRKSGMKEEAQREQDAFVSLKKQEESAGAAGAESTTKDEETPR